MDTNAFNTISRALVEDKGGEPRNLQVSSPRKKESGRKMNSSLSSEKEATE